MIVYDLECEHAHRFEGWFGSGDDYEQQQDSKVLACPICNSTNVTRRPSAAYVNTGVAQKPEPAGTSTAGVPQQYANLSPEIMAKVIEHIVKNTENVGARFPEEARKIHYQEAPERHIRGTASAREVESLRDEGIEVVPLPIPPTRKETTH